MKKAQRLVALLALTALAAALAAGCTPERDAITVNMATKPMTEQYILGSLFEQLCAKDGRIKINLTTGVGGGTSNIQPGMLSKEFDIYPEYTGTGWNTVLKKTDFYSEALFDDLQAGYAEMDMTWAGMIGFNNTYGIAVRTEIAQSFGLQTCSDLAELAPSLTFGANYDFYEREDGMPLLESAYGMTFADTKDMDIGLKYDAILGAEIDVTTVFTTDGRLAEPGITVLRDDKGIYPSYMCGFVVRQEALTAELQEIIDKFVGLISDADMAQMNYRVEIEGREPEDVARDFLRAKGLL